jgi:glucan 1,3-beta-glucosidase
VNIGGWFVLEPFISPALFQRYAAAGAIDEWTITQLMAADTANGGIQQLEDHYDTFVVRQTIPETPRLTRSDLRPLSSST